MINSVKKRERESSDSLAILVSNPWIRQIVEYLASLIAFSDQTLPFRLECNPPMEMPGLQSILLFLFPRLIKKRL